MVARALDPQILEALTAGADGGFRPPRPAARGDWKTLRAITEESMAQLLALPPEHTDVARATHHVTSHDGATVPARWYTPAGHTTGAAGPAVVYLHGGGMIAGTVDLYDKVVAAYVADSGVPALAVDYRRAPEHPHPTPVEDSYAGLVWLAAHAGELGVDSRRIALMGDSGGGGLAAAAALLARERSGPAIAKQILVYPMLDDRTTEPEAALAPFVGSSYDDNHTRWQAVLGDTAEGPGGPGSRGVPGVPATAAPARAHDVSGLPPAYVEVGELDIFRDESMEYARRMATAGTPVELHVHPGCPHGFDLLAPQADVVRRSRADRLRALTTL
ncbi:alpha/beta hydrolase [Streptomyces sp. NPDC054796]